MPTIDQVSERLLDQPPRKISLQGHYNLSYWYDSRGKTRTFACRTITVSPFQLTLAVTVGGKVGDRIKSCFPDLGNLDGNISDTFTGGFIVEPKLTRLEQERVANKLIWLERKKRDPSIRDARSHERFVPENPHSTLTFADGSIRSCFVIHMSVTGAAVSAEVQPAIGTPLAIGACVGRVVRSLPEGFAVHFIDALHSNDLNRLIVRPLWKAKVPEQLLLANGAAESDH